MNEDDEIFTINPESFDGAMGLLYESIFEKYSEQDKLVSLDELSQLFKTNFGIEDGTCLFNAIQLKEFIEHINTIIIDRVLAGLVKKGMIDVYHDGNDFCFKTTEAGKKALDNFDK